MATTPPRLARAPTTQKTNAAGDRSFGWSLAIGRLFGIEVRVHVTFLLLLAWVAVSHLARGHGFGGALVGLLVILCVFGTVVLHELAHSLVARHYGVKTRDITLLPIGGISSLERIPEKARQELLIALAGPAVNIALALVLFGARALLHAGAGSFLATLMWINVSLAVFNLVPAFPMDGGRLLRSLLALRMSYGRATALAARVGQAAAVLFGIIGAFYNPILMLIAIFVWFGARQEAAMVSLRTGLAGVPVQRAMITEFKTLRPDDRLRDAVDLTLRGFQGDFPVLDGDRLVGLLTRESLLRAIAGRGPLASVGDVMRKDVPVVAAADPLDRALGTVTSGGGTVAVVDETGTLAGLLTLENVAELTALANVERGRGTGVARPAPP